MTLPVRRRPGDHLDRPGRVDADRRLVPPAGGVADRPENARRREPAHLVVRREPDAELLRAAVVAALLLLGPERVEVERLEELVERRVVVPGVDREPRGHRLRELRDEVLPSQLQPIHAELVRKGVDRPLDHVGRLGPPGPAIGVRGRRVREHAREHDAVVRDVVRAGVDPCPEERDPRRHELEVRPHRRLNPGTAVGDRPVLRRRQRVLGHDVAAVDRRQVVLRALLDPLHRPVQAPGEREREELLRVYVQLRSESASDVRRDDAQLRLVEAERGGGEHTQEVRDLRGRVEGEVSRASRNGKHGTRLDRVRDEPRLVVASRDDHVRVLELLARRVGVEAPHVALVRAEVGVGERGSVVERRRHVGDRVERLPVDLDELRGVLRLGARLGDHDRHSVSLVARDVGQRVVRRVLHVLGDRPRARHRRLPVVLDVGRREDREDAVGRPGRGKIDLADARMCVRAPDDHHEGGPHGGHVVDERAAAGEERLVLPALDRRADVRSSFLGGAHEALPIAPAALSTAATMLW